jgi:hypothetical protein
MEDFKKKKSPYPEASQPSSEYLKGRRTLPKELLPSQEYKRAVVDDMLARINKVDNPDIDIAMKAMEAEDLKTKKAYEEVVRLRELQKKLDVPDLPRHHKGKINAVDKIIQQLGFEKIPNISGARAKNATDAFSYLQKKTMKVVPGLAPIAIGLGAAGYSDLAGAATDLAIPGGVEELGVSDERSIPDPRYQEYIRKMQAKGKK